MTARIKPRKQSARRTSATALATRLQELGYSPRREDRAEIVLLIREEREVQAWAMDNLTRATSEQFRHNLTVAKDNAHGVEQLLRAALTAYKAREWDEAAGILMLTSGKGGKTRAARPVALVELYAQYLASIDPAFQSYLMQHGHEATLSSLGVEVAGSPLREVTVVDPTRSGASNRPEDYS